MKSWVCSPAPQEKEGYFLNSSAWEKRILSLIMIIAARVLVVSKGE
jgi:hypothetical protein